MEFQEKLLLRFTDLQYYHMYDVCGMQDADKMQTQKDHQDYPKKKGLQGFSPFIYLVLTYLSTLSISICILDYLGMIMGFSDINNYDLMQFAHRYTVMSLDKIILKKGPEINLGNKIQLPDDCLDFRTSCSNILI